MRWLHTPVHSSQTYCSLALSSICSFQRQETIVTQIAPCSLLLCFGSATNPLLTVLFLFPSQVSQVKSSQVSPSNKTASTLALLHESVFVQLQQVFGRLSSSVEQLSHSSALPHQGSTDNLVQQAAVRHTLKRGSKKAFKVEGMPWGHSDSSKSLKSDSCASLLFFSIKLVVIYLVTCRRLCMLSMPLCVGTT